MQLLTTIAAYSMSMVQTFYYFSLNTSFSLGLEVTGLGLACLGLITSAAVLGCTGDQHFVGPIGHCLDYHSSYGD